MNLKNNGAMNCAATEWKCAADHLPDELEPCLVIDSEGAFYIAHFVYEEASWRLDGSEDSEVSITHWAYVYPPIYLPTEKTRVVPGMENVESDLANLSIRRKP